MAWDSSKAILRNDAGDPVPQIWDDVAQAWVVYEGEVQLTGSNAAVHESLTVDNTVGGVGFTGHAANIYALITCETAQVRFTVNGTAPTTTVGHLLNPGDTLKLDSNEDITAFRAIRTGSVSGVLKATFAGVA